MPDSDIHAIWEEPLAYDFRNGPPYLPENVRTANDGMVLSKLMGAFDGEPMAELGALVALLRAAAMVHQSHHWQTRGANFYGDHLLFMRIYDESVPFVDQVAERSVGAGSRDLVCPITQASLINDLIQTWCWTAKDNEPAASDMVLVSLGVERCVLNCLKEARQSLESSGQLSDGTDNLLQGVADKHEEFVYLLQQRQGGRVASVRRASTPPRVVPTAQQSRILSTAYDAAEAISSGSVDVAVAPRTKRLAEIYCKLYDGNDLSQIEKISRNLFEQMDVEANDTKRAVRMLEHWTEVFQEAASVYYNLGIDAEFSYGRTAAGSDERPRQNRVNKVLTVMSSRYHDSLPIREISELLEANGFDSENLQGIYTGREGRIHEQVGPKSWISLSWHKMEESGRWEITAYVS